jgi:hypothetical protein
MMYCGKWPGVTFLIVCTSSLYSMDQTEKPPLVHSASLPISILPPGTREPQVKFVEEEYKRLMVVLSQHSHTPEGRLAIVARQVELAQEIIGKHTSGCTQDAVLSVSLWREEAESRGRILDKLKKQQEVQSSHT